MGSQKAWQKIKLPTGTLRCCYNFRTVHTARLDEKNLCNLDALPFTVGDDGKDI